MKRLIAFLCLFLLNISLLHAAVTINVVESGGDVVATASGTINLVGLGSPTAVATSWSTGVVGRSDGPEASFIQVGPVDEPSLYTLPFVDHIFTTGTSSYIADSSHTGITAVGVWSSFSSDNIYIQQGYISGDTISSSSTWSGATITSLALISGTYVFNWGSGDDADSLTLNIGGPVTPTTYTVGGTVTGLTGSVTLQNNNSDDIVKTTNDGFTFSAQAEGTDYVVSVSSQPAGQTCSVGNGSGTNITANITNVTVTCVDDAPPPPATPVPTMSVWGLGILIALMGFMGFNRRRKL